MAYSTEAELRSNIAAMTATNIATAIITDRIVIADKSIKMDLSRVIDFTVVPAASSDATFPIFIHLLSQYKTAELCLVYVYGNKREGKGNTDIAYWENEYNELLEKVISGNIGLYLANGTTSIAKTDYTFSNAAKDNIEPALGMGDYGEFKNKTDLEDDRPID